MKKEDWIFESNFKIEEISSELDLPMRFDNDKFEDNINEAFGCSPIAWCFIPLDFVLSIKEPLKLRVNDLLGVRKIIVDTF